MTVTPAGAGATVEMSFNGGVYVASATIDAYALPGDTYLSFSGRTGGAVNDHFFRNIQMGAPSAGGGGGGGGGGGSGTCVGDACGSVDAVSTDGPGTTYQLSLTLSGSAKNVYTIYGDETSSLSMPPSYQEPHPFGANVGGANPAFFPIMAGAEFDGWLTVGITAGDTTGALGSIGLDFDGWTTDSGLTTDNGAIF